MLIRMLQRNVASMRQRPLTASTADAHSLFVLMQVQTEQTICTGWEMTAPASDELSQSCRLGESRAISEGLGPAGADR
jgi:hypothetical protein